MDTFDRQLPAFLRSDELARRFVRVQRTLESMAIAALDHTGSVNKEAIARLLERLWARAKNPDALAATLTEQTFLDWSAVTIVQIVHETHPPPDPLTPELQRLFAPAMLDTPVDVIAAIDRVSELIIDLTIPQQMVATLHYLGSRKVDEIVAVLAMKECDVLYHLHAANKVLRARLNEERRA